MTESKDKMKIKKFLLAAGISFILYPILEVVFGFTSYLWSGEFYLIIYLPTKFCFILGLIFTLLIINILRKNESINSNLYITTFVSLSVLTAFFTIQFIILAPLGILSHSYFLFLAPMTTGGQVYFTYPYGIETFIPMIFIEGIAFTGIYLIANELDKKKSNRIILFQGWNKTIFFTLFVILSYSIPLEINGSSLPRHIIHIVSNSVYLLVSLLATIILGVFIIIKTKGIEIKAAK
ncbi:MAG: hypothetical protein GPJ50_13590 [Candidatus Heimdallarchaeota archaeon]|nr:hypothetical protein [Candidatus Heimdallarchaeota archaeon]